MINWSKKTLRTWLRLGRNTNIFLYQDLDKSSTKITVAKGQQEVYSGVISKPIQQITEANIREEAAKAYKNYGTKPVGLVKGKPQVLNVILRYGAYKIEFFFSKKTVSIIAWQNDMQLFYTANTKPTAEIAALKKLPTKPIRVHQIMRKLIRAYFKNELRKI